jgi:putative multicomponent Na+:H+ antiporter subunit B
MTLAADLPLLLPMTALLPLTAILLVAQPNPYQTLVLRGILGAVAALIYALLGAADVALTEALVGTLLSTTLYAVALRSSMVLRLGCHEPRGPARPTCCREVASLAGALFAEAGTGALAMPKGADSAWSAGVAGRHRQPDPAVTLVNASLRQRLAALPAAGDWQPLYCCPWRWVDAPPVDPASMPWRLWCSVWRPWE